MSVALPEPLILLAWVLVGVVIGAYGTVVGAGGGFALVPILLLVYPHQSAAQLTAVSLAVVFANAASGSLSYYRMRRADYRTGVILAAASLPGAVAGAIVVGTIPRAAFDVIMGVGLILVASFLFVKPSGSFPFGLNGRFVVSRTLVDSDGTQYEYRFNLALAALLSVGVGFLSSLLGIGGGIIHVPLLSAFFAFPAHIATATSHFVVMATAGAGTVTHILHRDYATFVGITLALAAGAVVGAQAGAAISRRITGSWIIRLLSVALGLVGIRLLLLPT
jgi:uncharacterized protein